MLLGHNEVIIVFPWREVLLGHNEVIIVFPWREVLLGHNEVIIVSLVFNILWLAVSQQLLHNYGTCTTCKHRMVFATLQRLLSARCTVMS